MNKNLIAEIVLQTYAKELLKSGKPQNSEEFTVLAAIVAKIDQLKGTNPTKVDPVYRVISLGTGTKCVGEEIIDQTGYIIHDSHAEVIARRGFLRFLLKNILSISFDSRIIDDELGPFTKREDESCIPYKVKPNWSFYMYISDNPCGDACIYPTAAGEMSYTGAKLAFNRSETTTETKDCASSLENHSIEKTSTVSIQTKMNGLIVEKEEQLVGEVRTKSSRSDTKHPTFSMSCSDKLCRWLYLGLQGRILYNLVGKVELSGVIVGKDPVATSDAQLFALRRALCIRCQSLLHWRSNITADVVDVESLQFASSKANVKQAMVDKEQKISLNETSQSKASPFSLGANSTPSKRLFSELSTSENLSSEVHQPKRLKRNQANPCGSSINWQTVLCGNEEEIEMAVRNYTPRIKHNIKSTTHGSQEVTVAHTGLPLGTIKGKLLQDKDPDMTKALSISRLSRFSLQQIIHQCLERVTTSTQALTSEPYSSWKQKIESHPDYTELAFHFFNHSLFCKWKRKQKI